MAISLPTPMSKSLSKSTRTPLRFHVMAIIVAIAALCLTQTVSAHEDDPIHTMATIMSHLEHYPSASEKQTLMGISKSSKASANTKTLATAMIHLKHKVSDGDKPKLEAIVADAKASANEKTLAGIILHLSHMPSASDKEALSKM